MAELVSITMRLPKWFTHPPEDIWDEIKETLAAAMQTNRGMLFMNSGRYNGHQPWAPLKYRQGQPLLNRGGGGLSGSIAPRNDGKVPGNKPGSILKFSGGVVTIGSDLAYAAMMNWGTTGLPGGVLRPKNKKALAFKIGNRWIVCRSVKIPPRRFDTFTQDDVEELEQTMANSIAELLNNQ